MDSDSTGKTKTSSPLDALPKVAPKKVINPIARLAVCVATYQRPDGLERLLKALASVSIPKAVSEINVVIVDNDAEGSARELCDQAREWFPHEIHYVIEKRRGIPQARNTALSTAIPLADAVVFTDDDVEPTAGWLVELLRVQGLYGADVVAGPNPPRFLEEPPEWIVEGRFFESRQRATGTLIETAGTHNVLVRCDALEQMSHLFDERLALKGSEDTEFFRRMFRDERRMVWAADATVHECVPGSRMTVRWLLRRANRVATMLGNPKRRRRDDLTLRRVVLDAVSNMSSGCFDLVVATAMQRGKVEQVRALLKVSAGMGWLSGLSNLNDRRIARSRQG